MDEVANYYLSKPMTREEIAQHFGICSVSIDRILKLYNIEKYTRQQLASYGMNETFFDIIDTEEKAYFLGLLMTDGCIFKTRSNHYRILLQLGAIDTYMVERLHQTVRANTKLILDKRDGSSTCAFVNDHMANTLFSHGVCVNKPSRYISSNIHPFLVPAVIRGIFDGDGNMFYRLAHPDRKVCNSYSGRILICCHDLLFNQLNKFFATLGYTTSVYNGQVCTDGTILHHLSIRRKDELIKLYSFLYNNNNATIYLKRKKDKFEEFLSLL